MNSQVDIKSGTKLDLDNDDNDIEVVIIFIIIRKKNLKKV
jgi:hypothetical protein